MDMVVRSREATKAGYKKIISALGDIIDYAIEDGRDELLGIALQERKRITQNKKYEVEARNAGLEVDLSQRSTSQGFQSLEKNDKGAAFIEMQLSLLEAHRLASLDAIQEHDAQFARSLADLPDEEWNKTGDQRNNSFEFSSRSHETDVDIEEIILSMLDDENGSDTKDVAKEEFDKPKRAEESSTPLTILEGKSPMNSTGEGKEKVDEKAGEGNSPATAKGKEEEDEGNTPIMSSTRKGKRMVDEDYNNLSFSSDIDIPELEVATSESDWETVCQICFDSEQTTSTFVTLEGCGHRFCANCVRKHAEARVEGGQMNVPCLREECPAFVTDMKLSSFLSSAMMDILARRQVEAAFPAREILYCPFKECSALLIKPTSEEASASAIPPTTCVECESCHRAFCVECMVPWHGEKSCGEYRADLKNESLQGDQKLLDLVKKHKWQQCTKCGRVVDLLHGCYHVTCLCMHEFCFLCGEERYSTLKKCLCPLWEEQRL